eukprot:scaffold4518_cov149-Cylindrotheca_fusiformis.AAC.9
MIGIAQKLGQSNIRRRVGAHILRPADATRRFSTRPKGKKEGGLHLFRAGVPLIMFCALGVWVVSNGLDGKNKERDAAQGRLSVSERQAMMSKEHDDLVEKMNHIVSKDFDNTKRIERPDEILARRRREREARNVWYRRWWRSIRGET